MSKHVPERASNAYDSTVQVLLICVFMNFSPRIVSAVLIRLLFVMKYKRTETWQLAERSYLHHYN